MRKGERRKGGYEEKEREERENVKIKGEGDGRKEEKEKTEILREEVKPKEETKAE